MISADHRRMYDIAATVAKKTRAHLAGDVRGAVPMGRCARWCGMACGADGEGTLSLIRNSGHRVRDLQ